MVFQTLIENNMVPDGLIRWGIRGLLRQRLRELDSSDQALFNSSLETFPLAVSTQAANEQHYEVPAEFFEKVLGKRMKYSCALYDNASDTLDAAEEKMLALTSERADLRDGFDILELGCGWGSLTLWMAEKYPNSKITAVSNSKSQREFILRRAEKIGLVNIEVMTRDMNDFTIDRKFDRIISVEMFEHMRNIPLLLQRIAKWLKPEGSLFVHVFTHRSYSYFFEDRDRSDWMARHFFSGGMMPGQGLYRCFSNDLKIEKEWVVSGINYSRTAEDWLKNMDKNRESILGLFEITYGTGKAKLWWGRWRIFFMACAELWGWKNGTEWQVSHYKFSNRVEAKSL